MSSDIVVLHRIGDPAGGAPWREALEAAGWRGGVFAPDLPGHGSAPEPTGGNYELADAAFNAEVILANVGEAPVIVGVGANGWCAQLLALGGRAGSLVLVDGLGGPWLDPPTAIGRGRDVLRAISDDPQALLPRTGAGIDPRLRHAVSGQTDRDLAMRVASAVDLEVLVVETPDSPLTPVEAQEVIDALPHGSRMDARTIDEVAAAVVAWAARTNATTAGQRVQASETNSA